MTAAPFSSLPGMPAPAQQSVLVGWDPVNSRFQTVQVDASGVVQTASSIAAGETHLGEVGGKTVVFDVTLSLDTGIYASGEVLADTQQMDAFFRKADGTGILQSIVVLDEDDQGAAFDIYFFSANRSLGTENSAPNISDANARDLLGVVSIATTDYKDLGGVRMACIKNIALPVKAVSGTDDLYVGVVNGTGTPTYTASGIRLRVGALLD